MATCSASVRPVRRYCRTVAGVLALLVPRPVRELDATTGISTRRKDGIECGDMRQYPCIGRRQESRFLDGVVG